MEVPLYFYATYKDLNRLSPGSNETTLKVLEKIDLDRNSKLNILDIACGVGSSTILIANYFTNSIVEGFDLFEHYKIRLEEKIKENMLEDRVFAYQMDMNDPDFANDEFDIVFCEAGIEIMGFKKGLNEWKRLLKPNGYLVVSDISWLQKPSTESKNFWKNTYSEIDTIENKISLIKQLDYEFIDYVAVPKNDWKTYYNQLENNLKSLKNDKSAEDFTARLQKEINTYRNNPDDYTYVFYLMKKH